MPADELVSGSDRAPRRAPRRLQVAALVAVAGGVTLLARGGGAAPPGPPPPTPTPPVVVPVAHAQLRVGERCPPVVTASALTVRFTVVNAVDVPATLLGVEPVLPGGGLTPAGSSLEGGSCAASQPDAPGSLRPTGHPLLVTFRFTLPRECPAPYPVQARVWVREDHIEQTLLPVYVDLGEVPFASCPHP